MRLVHRFGDRSISVTGPSTAACDAKIKQIMKGYGLDEKLTSAKVVAGIMQDVTEDKEPLVKLGPGGDYVRTF